LHASLFVKIARKPKQLAHILEREKNSRVLYNLVARMGPIRSTRLVVAEYEVLKKETTRHSPLQRCRLVVGFGLVWFVLFGLYYRMMIE
jgi:hypothetical protein